MTDVKAIRRVLAAAAMANRLLRRHTDPRWTVVMPAYLIGSVASFWVFERIAAFWS